MATQHPSAFLVPPAASAGAPGPRASALSRRAALRHFAVAAAALAGFTSGVGERGATETSSPLRELLRLGQPGAAFGAAVDESSGALPPGAQHFTKVITTQRQWNSLAAAFADGRSPDDDEWEGIRALLRTVYAASGDMEYLARRWRSADTRDRGLATIRQFRDEVKGLDKPALARDTGKFVDGHARVAGLMNDFFATLSEDSVGDMPAEL